MSRRRTALLRRLGPGADLRLRGLSALDARLLHRRVVSGSFTAAATLAAGLSGSAAALRTRSACCSIPVSAALVVRRSAAARLRARLRRIGLRERPRLRSESSRSSLTRESRPGTGMRTSSSRASTTTPSRTRSPRPRLAAPLVHGSPFELSTAPAFQTALVTAALARGVPARAATPSARSTASTGS